MSAVKSKWNNPPITPVDGYRWWQVFARAWHWFYWFMWNREYARENAQRNTSIRPLAESDEQLRESTARIKNRAAIRSQRRRAMCDAATDQEAMEADILNGGFPIWQTLRANRNREGEQ